MTNSRVMRVVLTLCITLFSLISCIDPNYNVGSYVVPSDQDITIKTVEFDLPIEMKMADSLQSSMFSILVGSIASETFGRFTIGTAAAMIPGEDTIKWGTDPIFKNMTIEVKVSDKTTLSDDQKFIPQNIRVFPLTVELDTTYLYSNSITENDYDANDLLCETVYTGQDTMVFTLPEHWGSKLLNITQEEIDSTELFVKNYFGLYFTCDPIDEGQIGGRINHLDLETSTATLTYSSINDAGIRRDTTTTFTFGEYRVNNRMDCESSKIAELTTDEKIFIEGMNGVKPHINGAKLYNMIKEWAEKEGVDMYNMIIARATMEFPFEPDADYENLKTFPAAIYPCTRIITSSYCYYSPIDGYNNTSTNNGKMNRSKMIYKPDAAPYFQTLVRSDEEDIDTSYDIWIMPLYEYVSSSSSSSTSSYYNPYYSSYYNPYSYYGGYGGYGYGGYGYGYDSYGYGYDSYGYGNYYGNYYNNYYNSYYGSYYGTGTSSSTSTYYLDNEVYSYGVLNGTKCERHPKLTITYSVLK